MITILEQEQVKQKLLNINPGDIRRNKKNHFMSKTLNSTLKCYKFFKKHLVKVPLKTFRQKMWLKLQ